MANLSLDEFESCLGLLAEGGTPEKLRDRLARLNAFHSRRGRVIAWAITSVV